MSEWDIKKPLGQCYGTGQKIETGRPYYAALVETPEGLQRRDFCEQYWLENKPQVYCYWKTTLQADDEKRRIYIDEDMLMSFFERLANETDPEKLNFRFVLALALMRKKRLKYDSSRNDDSREIWRLKVTGEKRTVEVVNPRLNEDQIENLTHQIGRILQVNM